MDFDMLSMSFHIQKRQYSLGPTAIKLIYKEIYTLQIYYSF